MNDIKFTAQFGDQRKNVVVSQPTGESKIWHVMIDDYYKGALIYRNGQWDAYHTELTIDDIQILGKMIQDKYPIS